MLSDRKLDISPFAECGSTTSTVGYKDVSGSVVTSIEVPAELIERSVIANVSIEIGLSAAGEITCTAGGKASDICCKNEAVSLDDLVETSLEQNNLHKEEVSESELRALLEKLQKSICTVQRVIANMKAATS